MGWNKDEIIHWHEFEWSAPVESALIVRVDTEEAESTGRAFKYTEPFEARDFLQPHGPDWYKALILSKFPTLYDMMCEYIRQAQRHGARIWVRSQIWLEKLPDMPTARKLDCGGCRNLTVLPSAPNLTELSCNGTGLEEIPSLESLSILECDDCPKLMRIGDMPNLKHLVCFSCKSLISIGRMPYLEYADYGDCPKLKEGQGPKVKPTRPSR
jgi:hypothetical protein